MREYPRAARKGVKPKARRDASEDPLRDEDGRRDRKVSGSEGRSRKGPASSRQPVTGVSPGGVASTEYAEPMDNEGTCPVCVMVHEAPAATPPPERIDPALTGEQPTIRVLTPDERAQRIREEWEVE